MANYLCNIAKGRVVEFYNRVKANDPAPSAFILVPLSASGVQATIVDADDLAAVLASATERTTGGWVRKTLTDTQLAALPAPDDVNDRYGVQVPSVTWTTPAAANNTTGLIIGYDADTGAGTDSNIIPLGHWDFAVTTDGNDVVLNVGDFFRAA
jgi:hypothetical protein